MARWRAASTVTARHRLEAFGLRLGVGMLEHLPHRASLSVGASLGDLAWRLGVRRRVAVDNIVRAEGLPDDPDAAGAIARACYRNLGRTFAEYARLPRMSARACADRITYEGLEHLEQALAEGRGVVALSGHFGSLEMMAASFRVLGIRPTLVVATMRNPLATRFFQRHRESVGMDLIEVGPRLRSAFRVLKKGGLLCLAADQDAGRDGIPVRFLGRVASTPTGPIELAMRTGAPVVWGLIFREGIDRHRVRIRPAVHIRPRGSDAETIRHYTELFSCWLEEGIRERPDHWFWLHRRWKTRLSMESG